MKGPLLASLSFPASMGWRSAREFLENKKDWLLKRSMEFPPALSLMDHFSGGGKISLGEDGSESKVVLKKDASISSGRIDFSNDVLEAFLPARECGEIFLKRECRRLAREYLPNRLHWAEEIAGLKASRILVRDQRTRWGSCSSSGAIALNWRMILLPADLGNYLLFHELVHLEEMNHSQRFWAKLERLFPGAGETDRKLSVEGKRIFLAGR